MSFIGLGGAGAGCQKEYPVPRWELRSARGGSSVAALLLCLLASGGARGESRGNRRPLGAQGVRRECPRGSPGALFRSPGSPSGSRSALLPVFRTLELSQVDFRPCCGANFTRTYFKVTSKFFFGVGGSGRRPRECALLECNTYWLWARRVLGRCFGGVWNHFATLPTYVAPSFCACLQPVVSLGPPEGATTHHQF